MRTILNVTFPHEQFNNAVKDGTIADTIGRILDSTAPEAVYFTEQGGRRSAIIVVDVADPSGVPALCEPWFLHFNADVRIQIAMTPDDLGKAGLPELGKKWSPTR